MLPLVRLESMLLFIICLVARRRDGARNLSATNDPRLQSVRAAAAATIAPCSPELTDHPICLLVAEIGR